VHYLADARFQVEAWLVTLPNPDRSEVFHLSHGFWSEPFRGIPPTGDAAAMVINDQESWLLVLDAIGHGISASRIAACLIAMFQQSVNTGQNAEVSLCSLLKLFHQQLIARNLDEQAAIGLFRFNKSNSHLDALLVGNLEAMLLTPKACRSLHSLNGMVGGRLPSHLHTKSYAMGHDTVLAVLSDGMRLKEVAAVLPHHVYRDFRECPLSVLARTLVNGYRRDYDDSSCALVRVQRLGRG
jgi:hypothetical protein